MATEEELIRRLRVLYGINPADGDQANYDVEIQGLERERAGLPATTGRRQVPIDRRGLRRGTRTVAAANPRLAEIDKRLEELKGLKVQAPNQGELAEAARNRDLLEGVFGGIRRSTLDEGTRDLNSRFTDTLRLNNSRLAARGLTGGSAARSSQSRILSDLLLGRQRLTGAADAADQTARQSLDEQRQATERQIKLGTQPDVSTIDSLKQAQVGVNQAYSNITQSALGGLFARGGDIYRDTEQADAYGRRGWGTVAPQQSRANSGGRIY